MNEAFLMYPFALVLLADGKDPLVWSIDAEAYNPANGAWETMGSVAFPDGGGLFRADLY